MPEALGPPWDDGPWSWFEEAPAGLLATTADGRILRSNRTLQVWCGRSQEQLAGQRWHDLLLTRAGRILVETHLCPLLAARGQVSRLAMDLVDAQGGRRPVILHAQARAAGGGEPGWHRLLFLDAIDRQDYEAQILKAKRAAEDALEELRELNLDLERKVRERTAELVSANQELDSFVHSVNHDLRTPLQVFMSMTFLLKDSCHSRLSEKEREWLGRMDQAAGTMRDLITGLLEMAQETGKPLNREPVDLSAIANRVRADLEASEPCRRVEWDIQPGVTAAGDPRLLEAALRNLLGNAWKYSSRAPAPRIRFHREGEAFCVSDNGAGFPMDQAERLFQPFRRLHASDQFPGLGIGLATVKRIIDRHGGTLAAQGEVGRGATFRFTLPREP